MLLVIPINVLFLRSTTLFCCGVYGAVSCRTISLTLQNSIKACDVNSPPLSVRKNLIFNPVSFSTVALKPLKISNASLFAFIINVHMYLL
ncbi:hypothetical protein Hanom_Chr01g00016201 [Helianthus anomalus]